VKMYKDKVDNKNVKNINVWRKSVFDIYFTEFGAVLTTVYLFCSSIVIIIFLQRRNIFRQDLGIEI
jgi:lipopolysaccharide/colanic/teichoic acid biosynthesis glycosyltransferase